MEDLPGDLEKEVAGRSVPKPSKRRPKWTLLFVGDDGRTRSVRPFKGLFYLFVGILVVSLIANVALYVFHKDGLKENKRLAGELNQLRQQVDTLRYDKDVLMARMVMTQTRRETGPAPPVPPEKPAAIPPEPEASPRKTPSEPPEPMVAAAEPDIPGSPQSAIAPPPEAPKVRVSVESLNVSRSEVNDNTVLVRFNLRKMNQGSDNISGHAFVVLRLAESEARTRNVTIPWASLDNGTPSPTSRGQYFSISRFKPMKFERRNIKRLEQFSRLTVYVFNAEGDLLLEEEHPMALPEVKMVQPPAPERVELPPPEQTETPTPENVETPTPENIDMPTPENNEMG